MMLTNDVNLDETKSELIRQYKNHIESVFGISVSWSRLHDPSENGSSSEEGGVSKVRLSSQFSQESLEKAKNYIISLTEEGNDFERTFEDLSQKELTMILENQNDIENKSQAVLDLFENSNQVCIYGKHKNVKLAQALIQKMREKIKGKDIYGTHESHYSAHNMETYYSQEKVLTTQTTRTGSNNISLLTERQNSLQTDCAPCSQGYHSISVLHDEFTSLSRNETDMENNFIDHDRLCRKQSFDSSHDGDVVVSPDDLYSDNFSFSGYGGTTQTSSSQTKSSRTASSQSNSDDENDEEVDRIIQDTNNRAKIEFAVKLGYSQSQIATVLKKLGTDVSQNEMLSELIKIGMTSSYLNENDDSEADEPYLRTENSLPFSGYCDDESQSSLRPIVIDGSNVAMSHGNKDVFSCHGIQLATDWFRQRGHTQITVFVPQWRKETSRPDARISDQDILNQLEKEKVLVYTPARRIGGKRVVCYDDRYVLKLAAENEGIVVSNDNYRDLINEKPEYKEVVEKRLLMFSFVNDRFMPPEDPLGRHGPSLDNFLKHQHAISQESLPPLCPYGSKKCTYGNKCKYYHPERGNIPQKSVTDKLAEQAKQKLQDIRAKVAEGVEKRKQQPARKPKMALQRTKSLATELPADLVADKVDKDFQNLSLEHILKKDPEKDEKWKQYDDKLSEKRRLLEKAEQDEKIRQEELRKQTDFDHLKMMPGNTRSNTPSPSNRLSPSPIRHQEQFLSGHLLLAKKLSDEANETKLRRSEEHSYTKSPLAATQSHPVVSMPTHTASQQPQHKKLSRQYSLQGAQDPRLKPNVRPQMSFDPNMMYHQQSSYSGEQFRQQSHQTNMMQRPVEQTPFYRSEDENYLHSANYVSESYNHKLMTANEGSFLCPESGSSQHMALTRMQSAPEVPQHLRDRNQPSGRHIGKMMRQNSSSDTQLHVMGGENDQFGFNMFPQGNVERSTYTTRQDSVTYHIGAQNQHEQIRRSSSAVGQYHYQTDQTFPQHQPLSHDNQWSYPNQGMQQGYNIGSSPDIRGHRPLFNRGASHEFTSLRPRGQVWSNQHNMQPSYAAPCDLHVNNDPYQQHMMSNPNSAADFHVQSQRGADSFGAQSRQFGVPILGAQSSHSQNANYQQIPPTDKRYSIYYHLCGLFPEEKVRTVMNQFPDLDDPQKICALLL